ncbi:hypothetical protein PGTUg99_035410 [Puccinia graminis f. sp. tritici]|uniref:Uncharacterized protein n=1 Tax=Puccinia graminis f. sp. tritici TaxID=56615 RepID=A0A5B0P457_PUCGR|nr:hypothetical protein PGTUg99_035410 [Puccinia graminis f. sp. tritici]
MGTLHPDIRLLFPGKVASASPGGYPPALAGIRADILGYRPLNSRRGTSSPAGKVAFQPARHVPFQLARYMYLAGWKETLPIDEVHVPRQLEGNSWRGTCTSPAGRETFQPARYMNLVNWKGFLPVDEGVSFQPSRYMYLDGWKETLPVGELLYWRHLCLGGSPLSSSFPTRVSRPSWCSSQQYMPRRLEGNPSSRRGTCLADWKDLAGCKETLPAGHWSWVSQGIPGYPPGFGGERTSAPESASPGGYPLALADIRQRIADIRNGLSPPISKTNTIV